MTIAVPLHTRQGQCVFEEANLSGNRQASCLFPQEREVTFLNACPMKIHRTQGVSSLLGALFAVGVVISRIDLEPTRRALDMVMQRNDINSR